MNITLFSCGGILNFGIVATKDLRNLDSLAEYIKKEFSALEEAVFHSRPEPALSEHRVR